MFQQIDPDAAPVSMIVPEPLAPLVDRLNLLMQAVREMPPGGDLEGLIGTHLDQLRQETCTMALQQREQATEPPASDSPESFSPCALPSVPTPAASGTAQDAHDPDLAR